MASFAPGDLVLVKLDPVVGHEQGANPGNELRPCVVVSDTEALVQAGDFEVYAVVPLTASKRVKGVFGPRVTTPHPKHGQIASTALVGHIRSIDPTRIDRKAAVVSQADLDNIRIGLAALLALSGN